MDINVQEIMEIEGLKWETRDLQTRIEKHNLERKALKEEMKALLKKIKATEDRYANNLDSE